MSNFALDHIFCFCESHLSGEAEKAANMGFTLYPGNRHSGQGTANRAIMFEDNYLEFIFLESLNDAQKNSLRLDKRADWRNTGASPFGICLRGTVSEADSNQFWAYHPPYWQGGVIFIHKSNENSPQQPLIFVIPSSVRPIEKTNFNLAHMSHKTGTRAIRSTMIAGPNYSWPAISKPPEIVLSEAAFPHMKVIVDGELPSEVALNELLSIVGSPQTSGSII